jgi:hypothetical protein
MSDHNESQLGIWVQVTSVRALRFHIAFVSYLLAAVTACQGPIRRCTADKNVMI